MENSNIIKGTYITVQDWMRTELNLCGNTLLVYAIIYGFSQDGKTKFSGSRQYIADWCGCSVRNVQIILNNLTEQNLLTKYENTINGVKSCEYAANFTPSEKISPPVKKFHHPSEKISHNNIDNINNIISKRNNIDKEDIGDTQSHMYSAAELKSDFLCSNTKVSGTKKKRVSLYDKCKSEIYSYTQSAELQDILTRYLSVRLAITEKPLYGVNQWRGLLNRLSKIDGNKIDIVEQSITKGWCSFYPVTNTSKLCKTYFSENDGVKCESATVTDEDRRETLKRQGKRTDF